MSRVTQVSVQHGRIRTFLPSQEHHPSEGIHLWAGVWKLNQSLWEWRQDAGATYIHYPPTPLTVLQVLMAHRSKNVMEARIRLSKNPKVTIYLHVPSNTVPTVVFKQCSYIVTHVKSPINDSNKVYPNKLDLGGNCQLIVPWRHNQGSIIHPVDSGQSSLCPKTFVKRMPWNPSPSNDSDSHQFWPTLTL